MSVLFLLSGGVGFAQSANVTAKVDRNQMRAGDAFTYTISISSEQSISYDEPKLPTIPGADLINTWSGSEMKGSFVNGQVQTERVQSFHYQFVVSEEGEIEIGPAEVVVNGQVVKTNAIQISVGPAGVQSPGASPAAPPSMRDPFLDGDQDDIFSQLLRRHFGRRLMPGLPSGDPNDSFYVHAQVSKQSVYAGEQVTVAFYLVSRGQILDIDTLKYPSLAGFWKEDIEVATRLNFQPEIINGVQYQKALLASYALFPIKPGAAVIDPYQAKCRILTANSMGMPVEHQLVKQSQDIKIDVKPLPEAQKPAGFSGGVGRFTLSSSVDVTETKAGQPVVYKVRIEGEGNAKFVDLPKLDLGVSAQVYEPKSSMKFFANGRSYKEFETLLVPRAQGELKIPAMSLSFFNPETKSYYTQSTNEITVQIQPGDAQGLIPSAGLSNLSNERQSEKLSLPGVIVTAEEPFMWSTAQQLGAWGALFSLTFLGLGLFAYRELDDKEKKDNLKKRIQTRLAEVSRDLKNGQWRKVGIELTNLISSVLGEISGQGGGSFEFDVLVEKSPPSFKRELAPQLRQLMQKLEVVGFAPESVVGDLKNPEQLKVLLQQSEKLLYEAAAYDFTVEEKDLTA